MIPNRSMHKTTNARAQLCHRRPGGEIRQVATTVRMQTSESCYDSPHPGLHNSLLLRNLTHMADNDYSEVLARSEFSNGGIFNNFCDYTYQRGGDGTASTDADSNGRDQLLPQTARNSSLQFSYAPNHLLDRMAPIFRTLKLFGFYGPNFAPDTPPMANQNHRSRGSCQWITPRCCLLTIYAILSALFNIGLFSFNIVGIEAIRAHFGLMHVTTMTNIISGMKPLQNTFNLLLFLRGARYHALLWRQLSEIDETFRRYLAVKLDVRKLKLIFFALTGFSFLVPFAMRASEYFLLETIGEVLVSDLSLLFVPLLSVWQLMPLFYYLLITSLLQWYFRKLRLRIQNDPDLTDHPLEFYYRLYLRLTKSVSTLGAFFNPVAFFSISTSVVVLCLTIYFLTNAKEIIIRDGPDDEKLASYFYVSWSGVHILVAVAYVLTMCVAGWRTNERARDIMAAVLSTRPTDEQARFRVSAFPIYHYPKWGLSGGFANEA